MSDVSSASFDETNRMRVSLGLAPLARPNKEAIAAARATAAHEAEQQAKNAEDESIRMELAKRKEQRLKNAVVEGKTLGESLAKQTAGSALDWVNRSRTITEVERRKAQQRAQQLAEQEQQMASYTSSDVSHIKVLHDADQFTEGTTTILTLKDARILKGVDQANDDEDELENVDLVDTEILQRNADRKKKKPTYDVYDEDAVLLKKYDEEKTKKDGIRLGELTGDSGAYDHDIQKQNLRVKKNLSAYEGIGTKYDLNQELKVASDYKEVKFKGKKKKEKAVVRKRPMNVNEDEDEDTTTTTKSSSSSSFTLPEPSKEERSQDHAKRNANSDKPDWITTTQEQVKKSQDLRDQSYLRALQKAELATAQLKTTYYNTNNNNTNIPIIDDDDNDTQILQEAIARTRRIAMKKEDDKKNNGLDHIQNVAKQVRDEVKVKEEEKKIKQEEEDGIRVKLEPMNEDGDEMDTSTNNTTTTTPPEETTTISLSTTTEFCRGLDLESDLRVKREPIKKEDQLEKVNTHKKKTIVDDEMDVDDDDNQMNGFKEQKKKGEDEKEEEEEEEDVDTRNAIDDEPTLDNSVMGALEIFRRRAMFESHLSDQVGRRKDKVLEIGVDASTMPFIRLDEEGRALKPKEAFRQLSHKFHGQKPGFKKREKEQKRAAEEERKRKLMMDANHTTGVTGKLMEAQKQSGNAFLVLDKGMRQQLDKVRAKKTEEESKLGKRKGNVMDETVERSTPTSTTTTTSSTATEKQQIVGDLRTKVSVQLKSEPNKKQRRMASEFTNNNDDEDEAE